MQRWLKRRACFSYQVNGGGGTLFNEEPTLGGIRQICSAHSRFGTTALLPTLITDTREVRTAAINAALEAKAAKVPGLLGLRLEGRTSRWLAKELTIQR